MLYHHNTTSMSQHSLANLSIYRATLRHTVKPHDLQRGSPRLFCQIECFSTACNTLQLLHTWGAAMRTKFLSSVARQARLPGPDVDRPRLDLI